MSQLADRLSQLETTVASFTRPHAPIDELLSELVDEGWALDEDDSLEDTMAGGHEYTREQMDAMMERD